MCDYSPELGYAVFYYLYGQPLQEKEDSLEEWEVTSDWVVIPES